MTEAWKSVPKKFCKICKCWFYDNKVSVQHHEQGSRHKFNMNNKLREIGVKGREKQQESKEMYYALKQMETEALRSYKKDLKESPAVAEQYNIHMNLAALPIRSFPRQSPGGVSTFNQPHLKLKSGISTVWHETLCPSTGKTYYWNTQTGVTRWDVPEEGYLSIGELQQAAEYESQQQASTSSETVQPPQEDEGRQHQRKAAKQQDSEEEDHQEAVQGQEDAVPHRQHHGTPAVEDRRSPDSDFKISSQAGLAAGSANTKPFGDWETVEIVPSKYPNKRSTNDNNEEEDEEEKKMKKIKFAEKKMPAISTTTTANTAVQFKKRNKIGAAKNLRRNDDDD